MLNAIFSYVMENLWLPIFPAILGTTTWLAWGNRASEKVRSAIVTGLAVGGAGALITIPAADIWLSLTIVASATLATILINLKEESKTTTIPTISVYQKASKRPLEAINDTYRDRFCARTFTTHTEFIVSRIPIEAGADETGQDLYFDVLLRMVLDDLYTLYRNVWDLQVTWSDVPFGRVKWQANEGAPRGGFIEREEFMKVFPDSKALQVERYGIVGNKLSVPNGTRLAAGTNQPDRRTFFFKNPFIEVGVDLAFSSCSVGIGELRLLIGLSREESEKFYTEACEVKLSAKFNRFRSGHPEMYRYRRWVDGMFEELQESFDSSRHIQRGKDWYILSKVSLIKDGA